MTVPNNVLWFEVLLYLSLMLDALSVAFRDRTPSRADDGIDDHDGEPVRGRAAAAAGLLRPARRPAAQELAALDRLPPLWCFPRSRWCRSSASSGLEFDTGVEVVSCALTAAGLFFSFTGDARDWFNA